MTSERSQDQLAGQLATVEPRKRMKDIGQNWNHETHALLGVIANAERRGDADHGMLPQPNLR